MDIIQTAWKAEAKSGRKLKYREIWFEKDWISGESSNSNKKSHRRPRFCWWKEVSVCVHASCQSASIVSKRCPSVMTTQRSRAISSPGWRKRQCRVIWSRGTPFPSSSHRSLQMSKPSMTPGGPCTKMPLGVHALTINIGPLLSSFLQQGLSWNWHSDITWC